MTKEEAIKLIDTHTVCFYNEIDSPTLQALHLAIEALSAETVQGDGRNNIKRYPNCQMRTSLGNCDAIGGFCTSINAPICDAFHKLSKAVQGEWKIDEYGIYHCPYCHAINNTVYKSFCPNCGARMKGGDTE